MKTTLDLPDDLMRSIKMRAAREDRKLKDLVAELLRRGMSQGTDRGDTARRRVQLPLVQCAHPADPDAEMTPERVAEVLADEEAHEAAGR
ncbi:MAG: antitoxin [Dehalococcoidia bacterium]|nr:antitoxin [Dehalococcoidia bacterium]